MEEGTGTQKQYDGEIIIFKLGQGDRAGQWRSQASATVLGVDPKSWINIVQESGFLHGIAAENWPPRDIKIRVRRGPKRGDGTESTFITLYEVSAGTPYAGDSFYESDAENRD